MQPPAPRTRSTHTAVAPAPRQGVNATIPSADENPTPTSWSVVTLRNQRRRPQQQQPLPGDAYLDLHISRLMHRNKRFPGEIRCTIYDLATTIDSALALFNGGRTRLRFARELATQKRPPISAELIKDILQLCDLLERAYATSDGAEWINDALADAAKPRRHDRTDSSASDASTGI